MANNTTNEAEHNEVAQHRTDTTGPLDTNTEADGATTRPAAPLIRLSHATAMHNMLFCLQSKLENMPMEQMELGSRFLDQVHHRETSHFQRLCAGVLLSHLDRMKKAKRDLENVIELGKMLEVGTGRRALAGQTLTEEDKSVWWYIVKLMLESQAEQDI